MRRTRQWASALLLLVVGLIDVTPVLAVDPRGSEAWQWPTTGTISQRYGCTGAWTNSRSGSCRHFHNGVDIANRSGTPVFAAAGGVVKHVGYNPWESGDDRAWIVLVKVGDLTVWYGHLLPLPVEGALEGDEVNAGDLLGYMGETGLATGVHLHFAVERSGRFLDPRQFLEGAPLREDPATEARAPEPPPAPYPAFLAPPTEIEAWIF